MENDAAALTTYAYDAANQLSWAQSASGVTTYAHDADGNRTQLAAPAWQVDFTWDEQSRLTRADTPSETVSMQYDALSRRTAKENAAGTHEFTFDGRKILEERDGAGAVAHEYTSTLDEYGELLSDYDGAASTAYQFDALGSTAALLDESASVTDRYVYRAFGEIASHTGANDTPFTFVGGQSYQHDSELDLYFASSRHLDPVVGRWTSQDPIRWQAGDENLYRYVRNNPASAVDPSGEQPPNYRPPPGGWPSMAANPNYAQFMKGQVSQEASSPHSIIIDPVELPPETEGWFGGSDRLLVTRLEYVGNAELLKLVLIWEEGKATKSLYVGHIDKSHGFNLVYRLTVDPAVGFSADNTTRWLQDHSLGVVSLAAVQDEIYGSGLTNTTKEQWDAWFMDQNVESADPSAVFRLSAEEFERKDAFDKAYLARLQIESEFYNYLLDSVTGGLGTSALTAKPLWAVEHLGVEAGDIIAGIFNKLLNLPGIENVATIAVAMALTSRKAVIEGLKRLGRGAKLVVVGGRYLIVESKALASRLGSKAVGRLTAQEAKSAIGEAKLVAELSPELGELAAEALEHGDDVAIQKLRKEMQETLQATEGEVDDILLELKKGGSSAPWGTPTAIGESGKVVRAIPSSGYHGTSGLSVEEIIAHGLPGGGSNVNLAEHVGGAADSAFRGLAPSPGRGGSTALRTPVEFAGEGGVVVEVVGVPGFNTFDHAPEAVRMLRKGEAEIATFRRIPTERIRRIGKVGVDSRGREVVKEWIANPNYQPFD